MWVCVNWEMRVLLEGGAIGQMNGKCTCKSKTKSMVSSVKLLLQIEGTYLYLQLCITNIENMELEATLIPVHDIESMIYSGRSHESSKIAGWDPPISFCLSSGLPFCPPPLSCEQKCLTLTAIYVAHYFIRDELPCKINKKNVQASISKHWGLFY